jgi:hypothetical protein
MPHDPSLVTAVEGRLDVERVDDGGEHGHAVLGHGRAGDDEQVEAPAVVLERIPARLEPVGPLGAGGRLGVVRQGDQVPERRAAFG